MIAQKGIGVKYDDIIKRADEEWPNTRRYYRFKKKKWRPELGAVCSITIGGSCDVELLLEQYEQSCQMTHYHDITSVS